eukprot:TRINITY_DN5552_c0_g1_i2.p1 TRINITY_DN5552_c0_g1~~TRINITY_DN5552_c0_g1_i2.p1  ORF type:complete len:260 (+),score=90.74 TRINITY_DN5552_c0_g1_i2:97-780(+)
MKGALQASYDNHEFKSGDYVCVHGVVKTDSDEEEGVFVSREWMGTDRSVKAVSCELTIYDVKNAFYVKDLEKEVIRRTEQSVAFNLDSKQLGPVHVAKYSLENQDVLDGQVTRMEFVYRPPGFFDLFFNIIVGDPRTSFGELALEKAILTGTAMSAFGIISENGEAEETGVKWRLKTQNSGMFTPFVMTTRAPDDMVNEQLGGGLKRTVGGTLLLGIAWALFASSSS